VPGRGPADPVVESSDVIERRDAYFQTMNELGLAEYTRIFSVDRDNPSLAATRAVETWKQLDHKPTVVVAYSATDAATLLRCFTQQRIRVPQDVCIAAAAGAGADSQAGDMSLTCQRMHFIDMGRRAVELLEQRCRQLRPLEANIHRVGSTFVSGNTAVAIPGQ
jgi:DNA-binding LacI/PurR family transcriptional regulator